MKSVEFYFDFASPNCYVALPKLKEIVAGRGAEIKYSPVFLGGIFKSTNDSPPQRGLLELLVVHRTRRNQAEAEEGHAGRLRKRVFGAPTYFIDGEMYWGTPEVLWYLDSKP